MATEAFEVVEHTADIGIRAWGDTLEEMLENAAAGMFSLIADTGIVKGKVEGTIEAAAGTLEELLVAWLEELLYSGETRGLVWKRAWVESLEPGWRLRGKAAGADIEECREALRGEIKGVTLHQLEVSREAGGRWACRVIFDV